MLKLQIEGMQAKKLNCFCGEKITNHLTTFSEIVNCFSYRDDSMCMLYPHTPNWACIYKFRFFLLWSPIPLVRAKISLSTLVFLKLWVVNQFHVGPHPFHYFIFKVLDLMLPWYVTCLWRNVIDLYFSQATMSMRLTMLVNGTFSWVSVGRSAA